MNMEAKPASDVDPWGLYIAMIAFALFLYLAVSFLPGTGGSGNEAQSIDAITDRWALVGASFAAIPNWVKHWLTFMQFIFASSLLFVFRHVEARAYLLGIILSHSLYFGQITHAPIQRVSIDLASLSHLVWVAPFILMLLRKKIVTWRTPYGFWYIFALFQLAFSLIFDVRDSIRYLVEIAT